MSATPPRLKDLASPPPRSTPSPPTSTTIPTSPFLPSSTMYTFPTTLSAWNLLTATPATVRTDPSHPATTQQRTNPFAILVISTFPATRSTSTPTPTTATPPSQTQETTPSAPTGVRPSAPNLLLPRPYPDRLAKDVPNVPVRLL